MNRGQLGWGYRRAGNWRPETLMQRFDRTCVQDPHGVALVDRDRRLTCVEIDQLVGRLARHLVELGVQPRDATTPVTAACRCLVARRRMRPFITLPRWKATNRSSMVQ